MSKQVLLVYIQLVVVTRIRQQRTSLVPTKYEQSYNCDITEILMPI